MSAPVSAQRARTQMKTLHKLAARPLTHQRIILLLVQTRRASAFAQHGSPPQEVFEVDRVDLLGKWGLIEKD
jgi:hypothetical protein